MWDLMEHNMEPVKGYQYVVGDGDVVLLEGIFI